jgi:hypothetical protein
MKMKCELDTDSEECSRHAQRLPGNQYQAVRSLVLTFIKPSGRLVCMYVCVCVCVVGLYTDEAVLVSIFIADINVNKCRGLNEFRLA